MPSKLYIALGQSCRIEAHCINTRRFWLFSLDELRKPRYKINIYRGADFYLGGIKRNIYLHFQQMKFASALVILTIVFVVDVKSLREKVEDEMFKKYATIKVNLKLHVFKLNYWHRNETERFYFFGFRYWKTVMARKPYIICF